MAAVFRSRYSPLEPHARKICEILCTNQQSLTFAVALVDRCKAVDEAFATHAAFIRPLFPGVHSEIQTCVLAIAAHLFLLTQYHVQFIRRYQSPGGACSKAQLDANSLEVQPNSVPCRGTRRKGPPHDDATIDGNEEVRLSQTMERLRTLTCVLQQPSTLSAQSRDPDST